MDIWLIGTDSGTQVRPTSIHGMLWLQTHFEDEHWEALASSQVVLPQEDAKTLSEDAKEAGLYLNQISALTIQRKF